MESLVLKQYSRLKLSDLLSATLGTFGFIGGFLSILALRVESWHSERDSLILTIISLVSDMLSTFMAVQAYLISKIIREIKITSNVHIRKREKIGTDLDFYSFVTGIIGFIFGWASLITLFTYFRNDSISVIATIFSIVFDIISVGLVSAGVIVIESIHNRYFTNDKTRRVHIQSKRISQIRSKDLVSKKRKK